MRVTTMAMPSPVQGVWHLGPVPVRAYAICILIGILVAVWLTERRWAQRGGRPGVVFDIVVWAIPFGIVGGRLYHVATSWQPYFGPDGDPISALYIWEGGLGVWGAIGLGAVGAWIGARRAGVLLPPLADAAAPGIALAQGIGRLGNWFNNEVYGSRTDLPWGLRIHEWDQSVGRAVLGPDGRPEILGTFHPVFLYELLWNFAVASVVIWADRRWRLGHGRVFGMYVALYTLGRLWIEALRIDSANHVFGLRLNIWTAMIVGVVATALTLLSARRHPGREESLLRVAAEADGTGPVRQSDAPDDGIGPDRTRSSDPSAAAKSGGDKPDNGNRDTQAPRTTPVDHVGDG